ncbi:hypothetical protein M5689_013174 [Euphorbia peplus]|nr:hypothetical protein M5689_013174 [Euphorbia peplus]
MSELSICKKFFGRWTLAPAVLEDDPTPINRNYVGSGAADVQVVLDVDSNKWMLFVDGEDFPEAGDFA